ncbi:MAG TPA: hypothetical protein P5081_13915 [Phycisphaerae bacterium]|nr:hypothetical protein [Phycisphaerae bacterium]HRW53967.1 hypothetical protein [Phycisphaerae bacterium]
MIVSLLLPAIETMIAQDAMGCGPSVPPPMWGRGTFLFKAAPAVFPVAGAPAAVVVPIPVVVTVASTNNATALPNAPECTPVSTTITIAMACAPPPPPFPAPGPIVGAVTIATPTPGVYPAVVPITIPAGPARACLLTGTATTTWGSGAMSTGMGDVQICIVDPASGQPPAIGSDPRLELELLSPDVQSVHPGDQARYTYRVTNNDSSFAVSLDVDIDSEQTARRSIGSPEAPGSGEGPIGLADPGIGDNFPILFSEDLLPPPAPGNNYALDDGNAAGAVAFPAGEAVLWLNQFFVIEGQRYIDKISVAVGAGANGRVLAVGVFSDPNADGDPTDAVLLGRPQRDIVVSGGGSGAFIEIAMEPTFVGTPGASFFVGALIREPGGVPAATVDSSGDTGRSWVVVGPECQLGLDSDFGAVGSAPTPAGANWMLRAHGAPSARSPAWIQLPPDPTVVMPPLIERTLRLCPGESRLIEIDTRGWGMCLSGSGCESRMRITGLFDDGSPALACAGTSIIVDASVPPDYLCPDGGATAAVLPQGGSLRYLGSMPSHDVDFVTNLLSVSVATETSPPLTLGPVDAFVLDAEGFRGRHVSTLENGVGGPAAFSGESLAFTVDVQIASVEPGVNGELTELGVHRASPVVDANYFFVMTRSRLTGAGIPSSLDTYCDHMIYFSVDGITGGDFHRAASILQGPIQAQILDATTMRVTFIAEFPADAIGDCLPDSVLNLGDVPGFVASLLGGGDTCADVNSDGTSDGRDIQPFVDTLLTGNGSPIDEMVLQVDGSANASGIEFLSFDTPVQNCPGESQGQAPNVENGWSSGATISDFIVADNFDTPTGGTITDIHWWGAYTPDATCPDGPDAFTVTIHNDDANGVPGSVVTQLTNQTPARVATGRGYLGFIDEYAFSLTGLSINLPAGCYWLSIGNDLSAGDCGWFWGRSLDGDGVDAFRAPGGGFQRDDESSPFGSNIDLAWCLTLTLGDNSTCVEPMGGCCLAGTCLGTTTQPDCDAQGGLWLIGEDCNAGNVCPQSGDDECVAPPPIPDGATLVDLTVATSSFLPACGDFPFGDDTIHKDLFFEYAASCSGTLFVDTCGTATDTRLAIYDTDCAAIGGGAPPIECNDDHGNLSEGDTGVSCPNSLSASLSIPVTMGSTYIIRVGTFSESTQAGVIDLNIACQP